MSLARSRRRGGGHGGVGLPRIALWLPLAIGLATTAAAHPAPFSYLDLRLSPAGLEGSLVVHVLDLAHDLEIPDPAILLDPAAVAIDAPRMYALLASRLSIEGSGGDAAPVFSGIQVLVDRQALRFDLRAVRAATPRALRITAALFPYDPNHQTFLNVYEDGILAHQAILDRGHPDVEYFRGTLQGRVAVVQRFIAEGIRHIVIGPDHVLFLVGLLLLGGRITQLVKIVTAFTVAHSVTLSLAALDLVSPSARLVEPAIALSIVYVGADNLLISGEGRDVRAWIALAFGLIHGFGFASVLKEIGLPGSALGWSLFSFNVGVEVGQLLIVVVLAFLLGAVRRRSAAAGRWLAVVGSVAVIAAGAFWFVQRVFFEGGM